MVELQAKLRPLRFMKGWCEKTLEHILEGIFSNGSVRGRQELSEILGVPDRTVRNIIRRARRDGLPIMALPDGGYKIAQTNEEKQKLLRMYRGRAMDELRTYSALKKSLQLDGQISVADFTSTLCAAKEGVCNGA